MKKLKRVLCLAMLSVVMLAGCGKKNDFDYEKNYPILWDKYQTVLKNQSGAGVTCQPTGTGFFEMKAEESLVVFPSQFGYPTSSSGVPGYTVAFNDGLCSLDAQSGWTITANQSVLYVYNKEQMISGQFIPGNLDKANGGVVADKDSLKAYIGSLFSTSTNDYSFTDIYLGDSSNAGVNGHCTVSMDGQSYVINCGMVSDGKTTITYTFLYAGGNNASKEETIKNLISQCYIGTKQIRIM